MVQTSDGNVTLGCTDLNCVCGYSTCTRGDVTCPKCGRRYIHTGNGFVEKG